MEPLIGCEMLSAFSTCFRGLINSETQAVLNRGQRRQGWIFHCFRSWWALRVWVMALDHLSQLVKWPRTTQYMDLLSSADAKLLSFASKCVFPVVSVLLWFQFSVLFDLFWILTCQICCYFSRNPRNIPYPMTSPGDYLEKWSTRFLHRSERFIDGTFKQAEMSLGYWKTTTAVSSFKLSSFEGSTVKHCLVTLLCCGCLS
jgi:hypothetical protein